MKSSSWGVSTKYSLVINFSNPPRWFQNTVAEYLIVSGEGGGGREEKRIVSIFCTFERNISNFIYFRTMYT